MSSAEDYHEYHDTRYDRRRTSNRPRRRGSAQSHRRHRYDDGYAARKSRRSKAWYSLNTSRIIAACMFIFLLAYEVVILKGPLTKADIPSLKRSATSKTLITNPPPTTKHMDRPHVNRIENNPHNPPSKPIEHEKHPQPPTSASQPNVRAPVSLAAGSTVAERVKAAAQPPSSQPINEPPPFRPLRKQRRPSTKSNSLDQKKPPPASALRLESQAADSEDNDAEDPDVPRSKNRRSSRTSGGRRPKRTKKTSPDTDEDIDVNPPKVRKRVKVGEGGAAPGASENFWQWFQETKASEKGPVSSSIECPEENKRLCQMVYKYLRKYKVRCIFDASCARTLDWMPVVLRKAGNELWGFKYYCGITDESKMQQAKDKLESLNFIEFATDQWWRDGFPEDTELLFAWDTLPHIAYGRVWNFFVKAKKQEIKYILVDNYPGIMNDPSPKRNYLNLRKHPFRFPAAKEVVQNVTEPGETGKRQLLFYEGESLPDNLQ